jgi:DnaD/phage-associated family protein
MTSPDSGLDHAVALPGSYLIDVMSRVSDLSQLRAVLAVALRSADLGSPLISLNDLLESDLAALISGTGSPEPAVARARRSIDCAVIDGLLLRITTSSGDASDVKIGLATVYSRELVGAMGSGDPDAGAALGIGEEDRVAIERPNIFGLYEHHIGALTPMLGEELRDAERTYPRRWIEEAMRIAADYNKRTWPYVLSILRRWEEEGAPDSLIHRETR